MGKPHALKLQRCDDALERLTSRLIRTVNAIAKVRDQRKRLMKLLPVAKPKQKAEPVTVQPVPEPVTAPVQEVQKVQEGPLDIPVYLRRSQPNEADEKAKAEILAEIAAKKKVKADASKAKSKAKLAGDLKRMPLQGKAALAAIRGEA